MWAIKQIKKKGTQAADIICIFPFTIINHQEKRQRKVNTTFALFMEITKIKSLNSPLLCNLVIKQVWLFVLEPFKKKICLNLVEALSES